MKISDFHDLSVYQLASEGADWIRARSRSWPASDPPEMRRQILDSSSSVEALIAEGWGRRSESAASLVNKLSEAEGEVAETRSWLWRAKRSGYVTEDEYELWNNHYIKIAAKLRHMRLHPRQWCPERAFRSRGSSRL